RQGLFSDLKNKNGVGPTQRWCQSRL
ncbi:uncharacterized protein METZ01_LOCUS153578, partial [marine metagenome]